MLGALRKSSEDPEPKPGPFGKYYLQEMISSGGMAEIWLATDEKQKAYALRRMHERLRFSFSARKRFLKGCDILAKISDHKNIITFVEQGKIDGQLYCLTEYVEAVTLKDLYARQDPVLLDNVAQILIDMVDGLDHMHQSGFMHLDYKPENILVTQNAAVRLIDFDLAQPIPDKPTKFTKTNPGTPGYMAPEQLKGEPLTHHVDIFAFGVTAYELLTYQKPFPGDTPADILKRQLDRSEFVEPSLLNPDIPPALEKVVLRCLEADPWRRHPFMGVMARELKSALYVS